MKHMNQKECGFYNSLLLDYHNNKDKSYLSRIFCCIPLDEGKEKIMSGILKISTKNLIADSDLLFQSEDSGITGKWKDSFWFLDSEQEVSFIDTSIDKIAYFLSENYSWPLDDVAFKEDLEERFLLWDIDFTTYIKEYKMFCILNGYDFDFSWEYDQHTADIFLNDVENLS